MRCPSSGLELEPGIAPEAVLAALPPSAPMLVERVLGLVDLSWVLAIALVVVTWVGSKRIADRLRPRLERRLLRPSVTNAVLLLARVVVVGVALTPIATLIGFRPRNILLSVTVLSVVAGAILAPVGRSYVAGFFVLLNRPYEVGDLIELADPGGEGDERGYVDEVTLRYTKIVTLENSSLVVPNETMRERDVRNVSGEDERSRLSVELLVTYESDLEAARRLLTQAARRVDGVIGGGPDIRVGTERYPAGPRALIDEFGDHGIRLDLRFWAEEPYLEAAVRSAVQANVWDGLEGANVEIAYPHTHHVFDETSGHVPVALEGDGSDESATDRSLDVPGRMD
ncbi:mechanosensitive ion channel [Halobacteria archaeon AArc-m2/3/4]|uniref:Mechanosensitive ion channel n=1 Tax=Natronoglomus mannanivorans TaxID=2979990 RepID=A0AAP3E449_9EURY|nr:mechanosensitive ion channel [Halobacteria archaeon AArc-xg1-1]MCU4972089.1 mechanosensitive ion channel [Halobacteria archaeon AArc-m2/3/4]